MASPKNLNIANSLARLKNKAGQYFAVFSRNVGGKQDGFVMYVLDKQGNVLKDYGSHTSVAGALKMGTSKGFYSIKDTVVIPAGFASEPDPEDASLSDADDIKLSRDAHKFSLQLAKALGVREGSSSFEVMYRGVLRRMKAGETSRQIALTLVKASDSTSVYEAINSL